jgi:hypothetical protein
MCECRAGIGSVRLRKCKDYANVLCIRFVRQRRANIAAIEYDSA